MAPTHFESPSALVDAAPSDLGVSEWVTVDQKRIDDFATATGDHQWIHVDPVRAADGPFGATVAHGFLTLSIAPLFLPEIVAVDRCALQLNYGLDRVRFPAPVPVDSRLRGSGTLLAASEVPGGVQATFQVTIEIEGSPKPACVAEFLIRFMAG